MPNRHPYPPIDEDPDAERKFDADEDIRRAFYAWRNAYTDTTHFAAYNHRPTPVERALFVDHARDVLWDLARRWDDPE